MVYFYKRCLVFFLFLFCATTAGKDRWPFSTQLAEQAVFKLDISFSLGTFNGTGNGTGFVVEIEDTLYLVTNFHITDFIFSRGDGMHIRKHKKVEIFEPGEIVGLSALHDLALIKMKRYKGPVLKLATEMGSDKEGYTMGFPDGQFKKVKLIGMKEMDYIFSSGLKANNDTQPDAGASGSPVFNSKGEVIGVRNRGSDKKVIFVKSGFLKTVLKMKRESRDYLEWHEDEIDKVERMAESGDSSAQFSAANYIKDIMQRSTYSHQELDEETARRMLDFYKRSAAQGHIGAQGALAALYLTGDSGVPLDIEEGRKWLSLSLGRNSRKATAKDGYWQIIKSTCKVSFK